MSPGGAAAAGAPRTARTAAMIATTTEVFDEMRVSMMPPSDGAATPPGYARSAAIDLPTNRGDRRWDRSDAAFSASVSAESGGRQHYCLTVHFLVWE